MNEGWDVDGTGAPAGPAAPAAGGAAEALTRRVEELEALLWEWTYSDWASHPSAFASLEARSRGALAARHAAPPRYMVRLGREFCRCLAPAWVDGPDGRREAPDFDGEWTARAGCAACGGSGRIDCGGCRDERAGRVPAPADFLCLRCAWRPGRTVGGRIG